MSLTANSYRGLLLKTIFITYAYNLLLVPILLVADQLGTEGYTTLPRFIVWGLALLLSIPWGLYLRRRNHTLLLTAPEKRRRYMLRVLLCAALLLLVTFIFPEPYSAWIFFWDRLLLSQVNPTSSFIFCLFDQAFGVFTFFSISITLIAIFYYKPTGKKTQASRLV